MQIKKPIYATLLLASAFGTLEITKEKTEVLTPTVVKTIPIQREPLPNIVVPAPIMLEEKGKASWFDDKKVASGERYDPKRITCAHRTLPFNTVIRVTNLTNGKVIDCRVNDRGPAKWTGKNIDLSKEAARQLGFLKQGVAPVKLEIIKNG